jgi:hypothetical protein
MKKIVLIVLGVLLLVLLVLAALIAYIRQDEPLTPLAAQALNYQLVPVSTEQNAFVGVAGFNAPAGSDFIRAGEEIIWQANSGQVAQPDAPRLAFSVKEYNYSCARDFTENCLNEIRADAGNIQKLLKDNQELVQRYLKIHEMPVFSNSLPFVSLEKELPVNYFDIGYVSKLLSARTILDIGNGDVDEGLSWIRRDMAFYRQIYAAKDANMLDKMIAIASIRRYAILLSLLIEEDGLSGQDEILRSLLVPLDAPREHFREAAWREHVIMVQWLPKIMKKCEDWNYPNPLNKEQSFGVKLTGYLLQYFFYKQNMTSNLMSELFHNEMEILDATPNHRLLSDSGTIDERVLQRSGCGTGAFLCKYLKNFTGEVLAQIAQANNVSYLLRTYDADALLRLVRAQLEYKLAAKQMDAEPTKILATLPPETFNPYTGKPFDFNAERGVIGFQPANKRDKDKRVEIRLSKP